MTTDIDLTYCATYRPLFFVLNWNVMSGHKGLISKSKLFFSENIEYIQSDKYSWTCMNSNSKILWFFKNYIISQYLKESGGDH